MENGKLYAKIPYDATRATGRGPINLKEQLAVEEAISRPTGGEQIVTPDKMKDFRWLGTEGWEKRAQNINGVEVHYNYNPKTVRIDDIKIKN